MTRSTPPGKRVDDVPDGVFSSYTMSGCRCTGCRAANAAHVRNRNRAIKQRLQQLTEENEALRAQLGLVVAQDEAR